jgi:hypothetical protein
MSDLNGNCQPPYIVNIVYVRLIFLVASINYENHNIIVTVSYGCHFSQKLHTQIDLTYMEFELQSNLDYPNLDYPNPRLSKLEVQWKMQGQSTACGHVPGLRMRSKPMSPSSHASTNCCAATKSGFNAQGSKRNAR